MSCVVCALDASLENCLAIVTGLHTRIMPHLSLHALCMWQLAVLVKLCIAECMLTKLVLLSQQAMQSTHSLFPVISSTLPTVEHC